jgi:hypothetical protein
MATCTIRWRSSGGRGEFEYVPADTLADRAINVFFEPLGLTIPAEVSGVRAQGKPRLRKFDSNNRSKLHLPQLIMAVARLPQPAREDISHIVAFPLENQNFVMNEMHFDIVEDDGITVTLAPLHVSILHSNFHINLQDRLKAISEDLESISAIRDHHPELADAIEVHGSEIRNAVNTVAIKIAVDRLLELQATIFGKTNAGSAVKLEQVAALPESELESEITGIEGRLLTRLHSYKERDRTFAAQAKKYYKSKNGILTCEACGLNPVGLYGRDGERCIEAHHRVPIEQLQPDSITRVDDLAMVCASCHRIIHSRKPCLTIAEVQALLVETR